MEPFSEVPLFDNEEALLLTEGETRRMEEVESVREPLLIDMDLESTMEELLFVKDDLLMDDVSQIEALLFVKEEVRTAALVIALLSA